MKTPARSKGVTLIEVLIALVVVSIGLLGIAKMQALAIASTRGSSTRSLMSIEAASLASAMHANRLYWANVATASTTFSTSVSQNTITASTDATLAAQTANCASVSCTNATGVAMAAYDLSAWGANLWTVVNGSSGTVTCSGLTVACTITITWNENMVGLNGATQWQAAQQTQALSYSLLVQP